MKTHEETAALGVFGVASLIVFSLTLYLGFGLRRIGMLFGVVSIAFAGLILSVIRMQTSKKRVDRSR